MGLPFFIAQFDCGRCVIYRTGVWVYDSPNRCAEVMSVDFKDKIIRLLDSLSLWDLEYLYYFILEMKKRRGD